MKRKTDYLSICIISISALLFMLFSCRKAAEVPNPDPPAAVAGQGEIVLEDLLHSDKINIVDFYSDYCPPCVRIAPLLASLREKRKDIAVIKIDINRPGIKKIDWESPVAKQFNLRSIPYFMIFDGNKTRTHEGKEAYQHIMGLLKEENLID